MNIKHPDFLLNGIKTSMGKMLIKLYLSQYGFSFLAQSLKIKIKKKKIENHVLLICQSLMYCMYFRCGSIFFFFLVEFRFFKSSVSTITTVPSSDRSKGRHGKD